MLRCFLTKLGCTQRWPLAWEVATRPAAATCSALIGPTPSDVAHITLIASHSSPLPSLLPLTYQCDHQREGAVEFKPGGEAQERGRYSEVRIEARCSVDYQLPTGTNTNLSGYRPQVNFLSHQVQRSSMLSTPSSLLTPTITDEQLRGTLSACGCELPASPSLTTSASCCEPPGGSCQSRPTSWRRPGPR